MAGLIIILIAVFIGFITGAFASVPNRKSVLGTVVSIEHKYDTDERKPTYKAVVEYEVNQEKYTINSKYKSSSFFTGQKMKVIYNASLPSDAKLLPPASVYITMSIVAIIGIIISIYIFLGV